jgi:UDPglucose 6-dehydrogenase
VKVVVIGTGYVGLVTGACLSESGVSVTCVDRDEKKIESLRAGHMPIYEPGLAELVERNVAKGRLKFSVDLALSIKDTQIAFIAVGTPPDHEGAADLGQVRAVAAALGECFAERPSEYVVVVTKSTVPVGTSGIVKRLIGEAIRARASAESPTEFDVASNPEFLKEGAAIADFMKPDRLVVGTDSDRARSVMERLYKPFVNNGHPMLFMDLATAELTKYAANAMLATRISFMNSIANLCDAVGADVTMVRKGIGSDPRIGRPFLYAGPGYGGSCFPKDVRALESTAKDFGVDFGILTEVELANERQKHVVHAKAVTLLGSLEGKTVAVWGLAFKPNTDDIREAPSLTIIDDLLKGGARVNLYDPVAVLPPDFLGNLEVFDDPCAASQGADLLILVTEWAEFRGVDPSKLGLKQKLIIDARNVLDVDLLVSNGFTVASIGRPTRFAVLDV